MDYLKADTQKKINRPKEWNNSVLPPISTSTVLK